MQMSPETSSRSGPCVGSPNPRHWQLLCLAAMFYLALAAADARAGVITALSAETQDEIGATGADMGVPLGDPKVSSELLRLSEPWRLLASRGLFGAGAGAGSPAPGAGLSSASAALGGAPLSFRPSLLARGKVAERHCLRPPLVRREGPFHPPRNGG